MDPANGKTTAVEHYANVNEDDKGLPSSSSSPVDASPHVTGDETTVEALEEGKGGWFSYLKTRNFWIVIVLGYTVSTSI